MNRPAAYFRGTTSAHAENTSQHGCQDHYQWNYLRTRGEYIALGPSFGGILELPPRTRRILAYAWPAVE